MCRIFAQTARPAAADLSATAAAIAENAYKNAADNRYSDHMDEASFLKIKTTRMSRPFSCMSQEERSGLFLAFRQSAFNTNGTYG